MVNWQSGLNNCSPGRGMVEDAAPGSCGPECSWGNRLHLPFPVLGVLALSVWEAAGPGSCGRGCDGAPQIWSS